MSREPATLQKTSWQRPHKLRWDRTGVCNALVKESISSVLLNLTFKTVGSNLIREYIIICLFEFFSKRAIILKAFPGALVSYTISRLKCSIARIVAFLRHLITGTPAWGVCHTPLQAFRNHTVLSLVGAYGYTPLQIGVAPL